MQFPDYAVIYMQIGGVWRGSNALRRHTFTHRKKEYHVEGSKLIPYWALLHMRAHFQCRKRGIIARDWVNGYGFILSADNSNINCTCNRMNLAGRHDHTPVRWFQYQLERARALRQAFEGRREEAMEVCPNARDRRNLYAR